MRMTRLVLTLLVAIGAALPGCKDEEPLGPVDASAPREGGSEVGSTGDGGAGDADGPPAALVIDCFKGTPKTHEELLNACWDETVAAVVGKPVKLPGGYKVGSPLPPLP